MISIADIDNNALTILRKLKHAGFEAYFVGGCVRDLLLKHTPKDFDIATNATPDEISNLFKNCRLIGRRFRLAHIFFGRQIIEVATFRGSHEDAVEEESGSTHVSGLIIRDNVYGSLEEDAWRRDFTVNALYYDPDEERVVDIVSGLPDLQQRVLRIIGEPTTRYREDPVRMLRAIRFAAKLAFTIEDKTAEAIFSCNDALNFISNARLFDEVVKLFHGGSAFLTFKLLERYRFLEKLFPLTCEALTRDKDGKQREFLQCILINTDERIHSGKTTTPAFLFAAMLWYPLQSCMALLEEQSLSSAVAFDMAIKDVLHKQRKHTAIPRYLTTVMREIWSLQQRLMRLQGMRPLRLLRHPRFRAGYDFLLLRSQVGEVDPQIVDWWTRFQEDDEVQRSNMLRALTKGKDHRRKHKKNEK